jgi:hypothetical protein
MRPLKNFDEFLKDGIIRKRTPDNRRANSLKEDAENRYKFVQQMEEKIKLTNENANMFIENCYDILISLVRAKMIKDGFSSYGDGAHIAEVSYMRILEIPERDVRFMNELRYFRNGIKYYGQKFDKEYAEKVLIFLNTIYKTLIKM